MAFGFYFYVVSICRLHPDKTRRIEFGRFAEQNRKRRGEGKPETFDFLGFKHISGEE
jgi:RNA-directed DNA polymerase